MWKKIKKISTDFYYGMLGVIVVCFAFICAVAAIKYLATVMIFVIEFLP